MIYNVIIAGGRGERFWPFSTSKKPKQLLKIISNKSMLEETIDRVTDFIPLERTIIVTGQELRDRILESSPFITERNVLAEPAGKNTCLAIGFAAVHLQKNDPDAVMVVLSADHYIQPQEKLIALLKVATDIACKDDVLVTIGINPTRPETAYGYIEIGEPNGGADGINAYRVKKFKEKPNRPLAQQYYLDRTHLWNSGMFIWSTNSILKALAKYRPAMHQLLMNYASAIGSPAEQSERAKLFEQAESISIDCAILELADNVVVIKGELIWDDIGSWLALERIHDKDVHNNVVIGDAVLEESYEVTAVNSGDGILATFGVSDLIIVKTDSVVMVAHKTKANDIKALLTRLKEDAKFERYL